MDGAKALASRIQQLIRPGKAWGVQAGDYGGDSYGHAATIGGAGTYPTFTSGVATIHTRIIFDQTGHGFGSEFS